MWRNRSRTVITMASVFFAVILSVLTSSLRDGIFDNLIKNVVSFYTGYVQVHRHGYFDEQTLDNSFAADAATEAAILRNGNVTGVAPRLESFALASAGVITKGCLVAGIDPEPEDRITALRSKLTLGTYPAATDFSVVLAEGLAQRLNLGLHDTLVLIGQGYHGAMAAGKYPIGAIARFGSPELNDKTVFMPLQAARDFFSAPDRATSYVLSLRDTDAAETTRTSLAGALGSDFEVMSWGEMIPDIRQHIRTDTNNARYVQGVLYMLICFGIFGTLLMLLVERKFEMGMLVAIGMTRTRLMFLLMVELVMTMLAGCALGIVCSIPLVWYFNRYPLRIGDTAAATFQRFGFEPIFPTSLDATNFTRQGIIVLLMGLLLSLYPMYKALRLNPVTAMKK